MSGKLTQPSGAFLFTITVASLCKVCTGAAPQAGAELGKGMAVGCSTLVVRVLEELVGCRATLPPGIVTGWPWSQFWDCWIPPGVRGWAKKH